MNKLHVLIDDTRNLNADIIVRNGEAGLMVLQAFRSKVEVVYLDHDLGLGSISGYEVLCRALFLDVLPNKVQLVTSNPVGRVNMYAALKQAGYTTINGFDFVKEISHA